VPYRNLVLFAKMCATLDVIARLEECAAVGSTYVTFILPHGEDMEGIRLLGEHVVPKAAAL